jgi:hypothetical protein
MAHRKPSDDGGIIPIHGWRRDHTLPKRGTRRQEKEGCLWSLVLICAGVVAAGFQAWDWLT